MTAAVRPRGPVSDLVALTALALAARTLAALIVPQAPYTDPAYYTLVAEQLAAGHGFSVPVIWSFLEVGSRIPDPSVLPVASNGHWMPLTSIVAAGSMLLGGIGWRAGQVPMVLLSTLLVPGTYLVARELGARRSLAWAAGILAIFAGPLLIYYPTIDNFAVFGVTGATCLYASVRAVRSQRPGPWIAVAGIAAGLATLARVDGVLLTVAPAVAWLTVRGWRRPALIGWGFASAAGFLLVLGPWLVRNAVVFGSPLPSAGGHTLWITSYNEQFSIGHPVDLAHYLAWGWANIIGSKVEAWGTILARTGVLLGGLFLFTFLPGMWIHRRRRDLWPFFAYWLTMFAVMGLVFTFHAPKGAFYHSAPAWLPFAIGLSVVSLGPVASWVGRAWPFLRRPQTHAFLLVVGVAGAIVLSVVGSATIYGQWDRSRKLDEAAAAYFEEHDLTRDVVLYADPATLALLSGNPGVAPPFDPYPVLREVIDAYDVQWVVVQLGEGATRDALNLWSGSAGVDIDGNHATFLPATPVFEVPGGIRIYPVIRAP